MMYQNIQTDRQTDRPTDIHCNTRKNRQYLNSFIHFARFCSPPSFIFIYNRSVYGRVYEEEEEEEEEEVYIQSVQSVYRNSAAAAV